MYSLITVTVLKYILLVIKFKREKKNVLELCKLPKNFKELLELQLLILSKMRTLKSQRSTIQYCSSMLKR